MARQSMPPKRVRGACPRKMFSATVSSGNSSSSWNTVAMPAACASCGPLKLDLAAVDPDRARVRPVDAGDDLDQRRLAGAVLAQKRMHLAGMDVEADIVQRPHAGKRLAQAFDRQHRRPGFGTFSALRCIGPPCARASRAGPGRQCRAVPFDAARAQAVIPGRAAREGGSMAGAAPLENRWDDAHAAGARRAGAAALPLQPAGRRQADHQLWRRQHLGQAAGRRTR